MLLADNLINAGMAACVGREVFYKISSASVFLLAFYVTIVDSNIFITMKRGNHG